MKLWNGLAALGLAVLLCACVNDKTALSDNDIGLRNVALTSENVTLKEFAYNSAAAGESKLIERSFENAPPMIPHDVDGMLEVSKDYNACLTCHSPENAPAMKATSVPSSHTTDLRTGKKNKNNAVDESRFNCNACHTPQANLAPLVGNGFKADFRSEGAKSKSNLLDVLSEGVR